jgi:RNA polymerase sigma-70 factor (ECF subfamily)
VRVVRGAGAVAEKALVFSATAGEARVALVGGTAGIVASTQGQPTTVMGFAVRHGRILEIDIFTDPLRLPRLAPGWRS